MRHTIQEKINIIAKFSTLDRVSLVLYNIATGSLVATTSSECREITNTGIFRWNSDQIIEQPVDFIEYLWIMNNETYNQYGKIVLGGYPDEVKEQTDQMNFVNDDIKATLDGELTTENISDAVWDEQLSAHNVSGSAGTSQKVNNYEFRVCLDVDNGATGTAYPMGSKESPVNNLADALTIAELYNFKIINICGELTIEDEEDIGGYTFTSARSLTNKIIIVNAETEGTLFDNVTISGQMDGSVRYTYCVIDDVTNLKGGVKNSLLLNNLDLVTADKAIYLTDVDSLISSVDEYVEIEVNTAKLNMIRCHGNFELKNKTGTDMTFIGLSGGKIKIASSCTAGSIFISGIAEIEDNSGAGCTVYTDKVLNPNDLAFIKNIDNGKWEVVDNQMIFYKPDNATEIARFNLFDADGNPAIDNIYKREKV